MDLLFGSHVRSGGRRIGVVAGVELDARSRRVTKIIFSSDGKLGPHAQTRSIELVRAESGGVAVSDAAGTPSSAAEPVLLSRSIRLVRNGKSAGHLAGVEVDDHGALGAAIGRQHWWTPRYRWSAADLDFAYPGEVRLREGGSRAA